MTFKYILDNRKQAILHVITKPPSSSKRSWLVKLISTLTNQQPVICFSNIYQNLMVPFKSITNKLFLLEMFNPEMTVFTLVFISSQLFKCQNSQPAKSNKANNIEVNTPPWNRHTGEAVFLQHAGFHKHRSVGPDTKKMLAFPLWCSKIHG